jgi:hypothetical protein
MPLHHAMRARAIGSSIATDVLGDRLEGWHVDPDDGMGSVGSGRAVLTRERAPGTCCGSRAIDAGDGERA